MKNKIDEKFYERKEYYLNLLNLKSVFNSIKIENDSDEDIFQAIITFQLFTGRSDNLKNTQPYISQKGFKFNSKELSIEDEFVNRRSKLMDEINKSILKYIDENSIGKKYRYPQIEQVYFNVEEWCAKNIIGTDKELKEMENYIYKLFLELKKDMDSLKMIMKKISKKYITYKLQVEWNINKIENTYGTKLKYDYSQEDIFINEIRKNRELIKVMSETMYTEDEVLNIIGEINNNIMSISESLEIIKDNLEEIHTVDY